MGFGGVKTFSARRVLSVRAQHGKQRVAGGAGDLQIAAFVHVSVVVHPLLRHARLVWAQRRVPLLRRRSLRAPFILALVQKFPDSRVWNLQGFHHGGQAFIAHALQFFGVFSAGLLVGLTGDFFNEVVGQLRHIH